MSPGSDPFNPVSWPVRVNRITSNSQFASPSIDVPYMQGPNNNVRLSSALSHPPVTFEQQPDLGGLGIMSQQNQAYYQPNMVSIVQSTSNRC